MTHRVYLAAETKCYRCNGKLFEGQQVVVEWDEVADGWKHRHFRSGLCHRRNRKIDHVVIMEVIENAKHTSPPKAQADTEGKSKKARTYSRDLPAVRIHLGNTADALPTLPERT